MSYIEIKTIIERKLAQQKRGYLTESEIKETVAELQDGEADHSFHENTLVEKIKRLNKKIVHHNINPVGNMTTDKENGRIRIFF